MTTGPTEEQCGTPEGGPDGIPLALRLSEGLGVTARRKVVRTILGMVQWVRKLPDWPWLDEKMGVGPGWGLTLLAVGFAMQMHWLPGVVKVLIVRLTAP